MCFEKNIDVYRKVNICMCVAWQGGFTWVRGGYAFAPWISQRILQLFFTVDILNRAAPFYSLAVSVHVDT